MEAGWIVTEVGRQPWVVYGYLRTEDAVTTAGGIWWWFAVIAVIYAAVISTGVVVIRSMAARWRAGDDGTYSPGSTDDHIDEQGPAPYEPRQPMPAPEPSSGPVA